MASVNIPSYHDDPNYRYRMPRVRAKVEGRGNGVKTNIMNMGDIARALKRDPQYPTKFCGCELGASSKFEPAEGKAIVNGIHSEPDVQTVIDKFIERFVLCPKCRLPEIDLFVVKGRVQGKCNACGHTGDMDNVHKVATFIIKNPPNSVDSTLGKKSRAGREERRSKKETANDDDEKKHKSDEIEDGSKRSKGADDGVKKEKKDKDKDKEKDKEKKKKKKRHHHHHHHQKLDFASDEIVQVITRLSTFLKKGERPTPKDFFQEVRLLQVSQDFSGLLRVYCALTALLEDKGISIASIQSVLPYIESVCDRSISGGMVLEALEELIERQYAGAFDEYARLLHALYEGDVIEEDAVLDRYGPPISTKTIGETTTAESQPTCTLPAAFVKAHEASKSFVQWLREADSASASANGDEIGSSHDSGDEAQGE